MVSASRQRRLNSGVTDVTREKNRADRGLKSTAKVSRRPATKKMRVILDE